ncbi:MAG: hypothetical protein DI534_16040 [Leifsonia xyli]|nr:MAG: hypothetical protein DI534_16040 [Leifsonia xyli]
MAQRRIATLSLEAATWIKDEITYIADRNSAAARATERRFKQVRRLLAEFPNCGEIGLIPGTRSFVATPYVFIMRRVGETTQISSVRHARQQDAYAPSQESSPENYDATLERRGADRRRALARVIARHAVKRGFEPPDDLEEFEVIVAQEVDEETLFAMIDDIENMSSLSEFLRDHGVTFPRFGP